MRVRDRSRDYPALQIGEQDTDSRSPHGILPGRASRRPDLGGSERDSRHADPVGRFVAFNIGGNKSRLAALIHDPKGKVYIHRVMTLKEQDRGDWKDED